MRLPRRLSLVSALATAAFYLAPGVAHAASSSLVISQVYGGGGNVGAAFQNDFIEIFNAGSAPVALSGWSVQYASHNGSLWSTTPLTHATLQPGQYYLIAESSNGGVGDPLPGPNATGMIDMSAASGKVALVNSLTTLTGSCPTSDATVVDFVGYGTDANCNEGTDSAPSTTGATANTRSTSRVNGGCVDTDQNGTDFKATAALPRNYDTTIHACCSTITCTAVDDCHDAACDVQTSKCSSSQLTDGTACDDGDGCTSMDACKAGKCGGAKVICPDPGACFVRPVCGAGTCPAPVEQPDGTPCGLAETCQGGACKPITIATVASSSSADASSSAATTGSGGGAGVGGAGVGGAGVGGAPGVGGAGGGGVGGNGGASGGGSPASTGASTGATTASTTASATSASIAGSASSDAVTTTGAAGNGGHDGSSGDSNADSGCGCHTSPTETSGLAAIPFGLALLLAARRRRR